MPPGIIDYNSMVNGLLSLVADKQNPLSRTLEPGMGLTEGGRAYGGTAGQSVPLSEFTNGNIRNTQTSVDVGGVKKYTKAIQSGERPTVEIAPDVRNGGWKITDGHHRLRAYYDLGISDIPVVIKGD